MTSRRKHEDRFSFIGAKPKSTTIVLKHVGEGVKFATLIKATVIHVDNHEYKRYKIWNAAGMPWSNPIPPEKIYRILVDHFRGNAFGTDDQGFEQELWTKEDLQHMLSMLETIEGILEDE